MKVAVAQITTDPGRFKANTAKIISYIEQARRAGASLVVFPETVPDTLEITARTDNGLVMGLRHKEHPVEGVQFHPESILTPDGKHLLQNFLDKVGDRAAKS